MLPLDIGTPNNGGPLITAGGTDLRRGDHRQNSSAPSTPTSGKQLWETDLPGGGQTTPLTYEADGRQYVVIAPGGHHFMETPVSDAVIAYALPQN